MYNFEDRFEILYQKLYNKVDFKFFSFFNGEYEEEDDHFRVAEERNVNSLLFVSSKYYTFNS